jgi:hypothetical protein
MSMHSTYWLIGCALCIASIGVAAATTGEAQDMDSSVHSAMEDGTAHDGGSDLLGVIRDSDQRNTGVESPASTSSTSNRGGSTPTAPTRPHQPHLGWQSLLPGSIQ